MIIPINRKLRNNVNFQLKSSISNDAYQKIEVYLRVATVTYCLKTQKKFLIVSNDVYLKNEVYLRDSKVTYSCKLMKRVKKY